MMNLVKNKKGSTLTEYAVIIGLIALVAWTAIVALGGDVSNIFSKLSSGNSGHSQGANSGLGGVA